MRRARASISGPRRTRVRMYSAPMNGLNRLADKLKRTAYCALFDRSDVEFLEPHVVVAGLKQQLVRAEAENREHSRRHGQRVVALRRHASR